MDWFFYTVRCSDESLYAGITTDVERRVEDHNHRKCGAKYTRSRRPVYLVFYKKIGFKRLSKKDKEDICSKEGV